MSDLHLLSSLGQIGHHEPAPRRGRTAILIVALLLLVAVVCWVALSLMQGSRAQARDEAALGHSAHAAGDCAAAVPRLRSALSLGRIEFLDPPVDRDALRTEIDACEDLERARYAARHDQHQRAVDAFAEYLGSGEARFHGALEEQATARLALARDLEGQDDRRAVEQYENILAHAPDSDSGKVAAERVQALFDRDVTDARDDRPCTVLEPARQWTTTSSEALEKIRRSAHDALSWSLLRCAEVRIARGQEAARDANYEPKTFERAKSALTTVVQEYPGTKPGDLAQDELKDFPLTLIDAQTVAAEVAKERLRDKRLRDQVDAARRDGGTLDKPHKTGDAGDKVRLTIRNATGKQLYVVWSGKDPGSGTVRGGSKKCGKAPTTTITIPAGRVGVAVRSGDDWSAGEWSLRSDRLRLCVE